MLIITCDRCGAQYQKNKAKDPLKRSKYNTVGVGLITTDHKVLRWDLCDDCQKAFEHFMRYPDIAGEMLMDTLTRGEEDERYED